MVEEDLVAWYPFNGNANDESGNLKNGIPKNTPLLSTDRFNQTDSAYDFDWEDVTGYGSDWQRIDFNHAFNLGATFSINVWINPETYYWPTNSIKSSIIIANQAGCNDTNFRLNLETSNSTDGVVASSGSNNFGFTAEVNDRVLLDQW